MEVQLKRLLCVISLAVLYMHSSCAQQNHPKTPLTINVDYSRFALSQDTSFFELSYLLFPSGLTLEKNQDTLKGMVFLQTSIKDSKNDSLIRSTSVALPVLITDTISLNRGIIWKSIYTLPVGKYEVSILGYDMYNAANRDSTQKRVLIERRIEKVWMSDIDICSKIIQSDKKKNLFYKNSYEVFPNPSLLFGKTLAPIIFSYVEMYNLRTDSTYLVVTGISDEKGKLLKVQRKTRRFSAPNVVDVQTLNITSIQSGKYHYIVLLADTLGNEITHVEKPVFIYNPHIPAVAVDAISGRSVDFAGMSDDELKDEFRKARYIANTESIKMFEKNVTTLAGRREFMANFWVNVEKKEEGITRKLYLDRISVASQRYPVMGIQGWLTDRGRVYILNGEPDEVQRFPVSDNAKPYEIWLYNQIENGVQFVFVDRSGYGNYSLVHSTKRGELQDEEWERNLR
jgi:GWxTD domain-containing protein